MKAVLLVGGGGTRLRPLTYAVPKPLIPVANTPLILHILDNLRRHGVEEIVLAASAPDHSIEEALGDGRHLGLSLSYSYEAAPLGSGLAVKQAAQDFDSAFFVCNGDVISNVDLSAMAAQHQDRQAIVSIFLGPVEDPSAFGIAELDNQDRIVRFVEKPPRSDAPSNWANAGVWLFEPAVLDYIPDERMDRSLEQLVFPALIGEGLLLQGFPSPAYWMDVGTSERYLQLHADILDGLLSTCLPSELLPHTAAVAPAAEIGPRVLLGESCRVEDGARLVGPAVLGKACLVHQKALVQGSVLWDEVTVGADAVIRDSILGEGCSVGAGAEIESAVLANGVRLGPGVRPGRGVRLEPGESVN